MLTEANIYDLIEQNKAPFWQLFAKPHEFANANSNKGFYDPTSTDMQDKIKESIDRLKGHLKLLKDEKVFSYVIKIRPTKQSHSNAILEYEFITKQLDEKKPDTGQYPQNFDALGYVPKNLLDERLSIERERSKLELEKMMLQKDKERLKENMERKEGELGFLKNKFESDTGKLSKALGQLFEKAYTQIFGEPDQVETNVHEFRQTGEGEEVSGTGQDQQEDSPQSVIVEEIAGEMFDNVKNPDDLRKLQDFLRTKIYNKKQNKEENGEVPETNEDNQQD